jgi:hypothetical protein
MLRQHTFASKKLQMYENAPKFAWGVILHSAGADTTFLLRSSNLCNLVFVQQAVTQQLLHFNQPALTVFVLPLNQSEPRSRQAVYCSVYSPAKVVVAAGQGG